MSAPIIPTAIHTDTPRAWADPADRVEPGYTGANDVRIVKADGLQGSLGLYEVTVNDRTELLTRELDRWVHPSGRWITVDREREVSKSGPAAAQPDDATPVDGDPDAADVSPTRPEVVDPAPPDLVVPEGDPIDYSGQE